VIPMPKLMVYELAKFINLKAPAKRRPATGNHPTSNIGGRHRRNCAPIKG
jgi:hypothetical protein